jgi:hypothetical protein
VASSNEKAIRTVCGFCHNNCGLLAYVSNDVLRWIKADPDYPSNRSDICPKGAAATNKGSLFTPLPEVSPKVVIIDFGWGNPWDLRTRC